MVQDFRLYSGGFWFPGPPGGCSGAGEYRPRFLKPSLLPEGKSWRLATAYDVTFAYNPAGEWTNQHLMSVNGKFDNITRDDFLVVADRLAIGTAKDVLSQVCEVVAAWPNFAKKAKLPIEEMDRIRNYQKVI